MNLEVLALFIIYGIVMALFGALIGYILSRFRFYRDIDKIIKEERKRALNFSRSVIKGRVSEQLFPLMPFFSYNLSDARFIGTPVDYIVFDGYSDQNGNSVKEIVFIEVKTGKSQLSVSELAIKDAVDNKRVRFEVVYIKD
ncbi:MAG: hypothetical protein N2712_01280 [Brevinematales bacterium]|nr:hypothetical protein [Brevinematales bacterium]